MAAYEYFRPSIDHCLVVNEKKCGCKSVISLDGYVIFVSFGPAHYEPHMEAERRRIAEKRCKNEACRIQSCLQGEWSDDRRLIRLLNASYDVTSGLKLCMECMMQC